MPAPASHTPPLSDREREILRLVVESFIHTADPVGSRALVKRYSLGLSPASVRNTMSDLEDAGFLDHPHTSAGRIPTVRGYRAFVDGLMETARLSPTEKQLLRAELERLAGDPEGLLQTTSRLLGRLSNLLGVVLTPNLAAGVLDRLEVVPLSSSRLMFVLSLRGGLVKTIVLEVDAEVDRSRLERVVALLNERLAGLTMEEIRRTYAQRLHDVDDQTSVVRLVLHRQADLFPQHDPRRLRLGSTQNLLQQPEFQQPTELRELIRLLEDEHFLVQLFEEQVEGETSARAIVTVGGGQAERYSLVTASYRIGDAVGTVGVLGPLRMDYGRVVPLVEHVAALLSHSPAYFTD